MPPPPASLSDVLNSLPALNRGISFPRASAAQPCESGRGEERSGLDGSGSSSLGVAGSCDFCALDENSLISIASMLTPQAASSFAAVNRACRRAVTLACPHMVRPCHGETSIMEHQLATCHALRHGGGLVFDEPGTGKTLGVIARLMRTRTRCATAPANVSRVYALYDEHTAARSVFCFQQKTDLATNRKQAERKKAQQTSLVQLMDGAQNENEATANMLRHRMAAQQGFHFRHWLSLANSFIAELKAFQQAFQLNMHGVLRAAGVWTDVHTRILAFPAKDLWIFDTEVRHDEPDGKHVPELAFFQYVFLPRIGFEPVEPITADASAAIEQAKIYARLPTQQFSRSTAYKVPLCKWVYAGKFADEPGIFQAAAREAVSAYIDDREHVQMSYQEFFRPKIEFVKSLQLKSRRQQQYADARPPPLWHNTQMRLTSQAKKHGSRFLPTYATKATLIVVPGQLVPHWVSQLTMHVKRCSIYENKGLNFEWRETGTAEDGERPLRVFVSAYTSDALPPPAVSPSMLRYVVEGGSAPPESFADFDVVIVTLDHLTDRVVSQDNPYKASAKTGIYDSVMNGDVNTMYSVLLQFVWSRVILDEGHKIAGSGQKSTSTMSLTASRLQADEYICLTGTPMPSALGGELQALEKIKPLLAFIRHPLGADESAWSCMQAAGTSASKSSSLPAVTKSSLLSRLRNALAVCAVRHTKDDARVRGRVERTVRLPFSSDVAVSYNAYYYSLMRNLITTDWYDAHHCESFLSAGISGKEYDKAHHRDYEMHAQAASEMLKQKQGEASGSAENVSLSDWQAARRGQVQANLETSAEYRAKDGDSRKRRRDAIQNLRMASLGATARVSMFQEVDEALSVVWRTCGGCFPSLTRTKHESPTDPILRPFERRDDGALVPVVPQKNLRAWSPLVSGQSSADGPWTYENVSDPAKRALHDEWYRKRISQTLELGGYCDRCWECRSNGFAMFLTPCGHALCFECVEKDRTKCPLCSHGYEMQSTTDEDRFNENLNPHHEVPKDLITMQVSYKVEFELSDIIEAPGPETGMKAMKMPKIRYLIQKLQELYILPDETFLGNLEAEFNQIAANEAKRVSFNTDFSSWVSPSPGTAAAAAEASTMPASPSTPGPSRANGASPAATPRTVQRVATDREAQMRLDRWHEYRSRMQQQDSNKRIPPSRALVFSSLQLSSGARYDTDFHLTMITEALLLLESRLTGRPHGAGVHKHAVHELFSSLRGSGRSHRDASMRESAVKAFSLDRVGVMLIDQANSDGWDLGFATHVFVMDPLFDASVQEQAISRVHRLGPAHNRRRHGASQAPQAPPVQVEVLAMKNSIDEYAPGIPDYDDRSKRNCMRLHRAGVDVVLPSTHTPEDESMCRALLNVTRIIEE